MTACREVPSAFVCRDLQEMPVGIREIDGIGTIVIDDRLSTHGPTARVGKPELTSVLEKFLESCGGDAERHTAKCRFRRRRNGLALEQRQLCASLVAGNHQLTVAGGPLLELGHDAKPEHLLVPCCRLVSVRDEQLDVIDLEDREQG